MKKKLNSKVGISSLVLTVMLSQTVLPTTVLAQTINDNSNLQIESRDESSLIDVVQPYVEVNDNGHLQFSESLPENYYKAYNLSELQSHFDNLNKLEDQGRIRINSDLSIDQPKFKSTYGEWTYHWWGYDRKFTHSQATDFANYCTSVGGGAAIVGGLTAWFPPIASIAGVSGGYITLVGSRVLANDQGYGVYVKVSWALVFDVSPL